MLVPTVRVVAVTVMGCRSVHQSERLLLVCRSEHLLERLKIAHPSRESWTKTHIISSVCGWQRKAEAEA